MNLWMGRPCGWIQWSGRRRDWLASCYDFLSFQFLLYDQLPISARLGFTVGTSDQFLCIHPFLTTWRLWEWPGGALCRDNYWPTSPIGLLCGISPLNTTWATGFTSEVEFTTSKVEDLDRGFCRAFQVEGYALAIFMLFINITQKSRDFYRHIFFPMVLARFP
jgi:hypothetical protein